MSPRAKAYLPLLGAVLAILSTTALAQAIAPSVGGGFPHTGAADIYSGALNLYSTSTAAKVCVQRTEDVDGSASPKFCMGSIISGGVALPMLMWHFSDGATTERPVFIVESSGTVASVSDGTRRSHYEAFLEDGDADPLFRLSSSPYMTLELGPGGCEVEAGDLSRASNVATAVCATPHGLGVGSTFHLTHSEANFPAVTATTLTVSTVPDAYTVTYANSGSDATSTLSHFISGTTDVHLQRTGAFTLKLAIGGGTKILYYSDNAEWQSGYDLKVLGAGANPLLWASSGYGRVGIGAASPSAKLHVHGSAAAEVTAIIQAPGSASGNVLELRNNAGGVLAYTDPNGYSYSGKYLSYYSNVTPIAGATGRDVYYNGDLRRGCFAVAVSYLGWARPAALTEDLTILTVPAKTRVVSVVVDTPYVYWAIGAASLTLRLGVTTGGQEYVLSHDVFTTAVTKGLADADLGTSINRANAVQGGHLPSWTTTTAVTARLTSDVNLSGLAAGQSYYYICVERLDI
jgi:hypothetical protein